MDLRSRLLSRAANHEGTSALDMFNEIPSHLRDSVSEMSAWLDTHEWSHLYPKSSGGIDAVWETTFGNPNQIRGNDAITLQEQIRIAEQNRVHADILEARYTDDTLTNEFDSEMSTLLPSWSSSLNQAFVATGIAGSAGYAVAFSFTVARNILKHRKHLLKSREFRKHFLFKVLTQAHQQGIRGGALAFFVSFVCLLFPPFQFLLVTGVFVGLARLGLELLASVVNHVDPHRLSFVSRIFDFTRKAFNFAATVFSCLWSALNVVIDWVLEGLAKISGALLKIGQRFFASIGSMMDWLLGAPAIVTPY